MPPSAPNAEPALPGNRAPAASARRPHPAPHRRPRRARNSGHPPLPGPGFRAPRRRPGLRSIPSARPSRAVSAEPSPLAARGAAAPAPPRASPPLPALHPRGLPRSGRYAGSSRSSRARGSSTAHLSRSRRRRGPPPYSLPGWRGGESRRCPRPQPPPPTSGAASAAQALEPPPRRASSTPGSRRSSARHAQRARPRCEGARARGRQVSGLEAGARRRERAAGGVASARGGGGHAAGPRPLRPGGPAPGFPARWGNAPPRRSSPAPRSRPWRCVSNPHVFARPAGCSTRRDSEVKNAKNPPMNHSSAPRAPYPPLNYFCQMNSTLQAFSEH